MSESSSNSRKRRLFFPGANSNSKLDLNLIRSRTLPLDARGSLDPRQCCARGTSRRLAATVRASSAARTATPVALPAPGR